MYKTGTGYKGGVQFNPDGTLNRAAMLAIMNPDDKAGLEAALRLKDQYGAEVTVLTMGLPKAADVLREALAMGADKAILVTDRVLGGADTWATSSTIAAALRKLDYDLIITGRLFFFFFFLLAIDGDTAQVGPEIAEHIGLPQVTYAIEAEAEEDRLVIKKEVEAGFEKVAVSYPCLITVTKPSFDPRFPTIKSKMAAKKAEINVLAYADLEAGMDNERIGLKGSPTKVKKTFTPEVKTSGVKINEPTSEEGAEKLFAILCEDKVF